MTEAPKDSTQEAERVRTAGNYLQARKDALSLISADNHPLDDFRNRDKEAQHELMTAARIVVSSTISLARRSDQASEVARYLGEAKQYIKDIYDNDAVRTVAERRGFSTEYDTEMMRDRIAYYRTYATLTNQDLTPDILALYESIIGRSNNPSARTLVEFERALMLHQKERENPADSFEKFTETFTPAIEASAGNPERVATIAARYIIAANKIGNKDAETNGIEVYNGISHTDETRNILTREKNEADKEPDRHEQWQRDTQEAYKASLKLEMPRNYSR